MLRHGNRMESQWEKEWSMSLRTPQDLATAGIIASSQIADFEKVLGRYQLAIPRYYAELIDRKNPRCPIRLQAIPSLEELTERDSESEDPLQDLLHRPAPLVTRRYNDRVLIHPTSNCSMYCRYCFRKTLLNELKVDLFGGSLKQAIDYVGAEPEIREVIFSGGDPFMLPDRTIADTLERLGDFPHVKRIRFHTRVPVTFPMRVTPILTQALSRARTPVIVVTHFNHPKEITRGSRSACRLLREGGALLLNQSVLLRGVNDCENTLRELSELLFSERILPYYLHHPDASKGTAHFSVSIEEGLAIYRKLKASTAGYLVPRYVIDTVVDPYKLSVEEYAGGFK